MLRFLRSNGGCRKRAIHAYFGFDDAFPDGCGTCDGELDTMSWLEAHDAGATRVPIPREQQTSLGSDGDQLQRGDWIDVQGMGLCAVVRVHRTSKGTRVDVERAQDLESRSFELGRLRWRKVIR